MNSVLSAEQRLIRLVARTDLVIRNQLFQGIVSWVVKDPLAMKYFLLRPQEHRVLALLDGTRSYRDIKKVLDREFPENRFRLDSIQSPGGFVSQERTVDYAGPRPGCSIETAKGQGVS